LNHLLHSLNYFSVVMFRADKRGICSEKKGFVPIYRGVRIKDEKVRIKGGFVRKKKDLFRYIEEFG
jgi:hypothetical protein